jgi:hypothetical protein
MPRLQPASPGSLARVRALDALLLFFMSIKSDIARVYRLKRERANL